MDEKSIRKITDKRFHNTLRDYYIRGDGNDTTIFNEADVLEYSYNDRTWRNNKLQ